MEEGTGLTVAIVEDHAMVAEGLAAALDADPDMTVVGTAGTLEEGMALVAGVHPDVVLMDLMLPDGDGAAATTAIRRVAPATRVVLITSATGKDIVVRAIAAGCSGMLSKTGSVAQVRAAIHRAGAGEAVFDPEDLVGLVSHLSGGGRGPAALTRREQEVLELLARGMATQDIAAHLVVSLHTVRNHVRNVLAKLDAHSRLEAVAIALREGLVSPETPLDQRGVG
jgi:DNA-binding NarL/FixJ family response regulator